MFSVGPGDHAVAFYQESELAGLVGGYLLPAIAGGGAAILVATPEHRSEISSWLSQAGVDVAGAWADGSYVVLDADETMSRFIVNGQPDAAAFWEAISPVLTAATSKAATGKPGTSKQVPARVFGEMVAALWEIGLLDAAIEVEALWNEIGSQYPFGLLCAYPATVMAEEQRSDSVAQICCAHSAVIGAPAGSGATWLPG